MHNEFTAVFERDGEWVIAYCPEIPGANGQGLTKDEARDSLRQAITLILEDRREEGLRACGRRRTGDGGPDAVAQLPAAALAVAWLRAETRRGGALAMDEPRHRRY